MKQDPCWDGYEAIGMKEKNGKTVPNCVPKGAASAKDKAQKFQESQVICQSVAAASDPTAWPMRSAEPARCCVGSPARPKHLGFR